MKHFACILEGWILCKNNFHGLIMNNLHDSVNAVKVWKPIVNHTSCIIPRKFYIRKNNNKINSIEIGRIVIADLLPLSNLEKCMYTTLFQLMMIKCLGHYLIYKYNFNFLLFYMTHKLANDERIILILKEISTFRPFLTFSFQLSSLPKMEGC